MPSTEDTLAPPGNFQPTGDPQKDLDAVQPRKPVAEKDAARLGEIVKTLTGRKTAFDSKGEQFARWAAAAQFKLDNITRLLDFALSRLEGDASREKALGKALTAIDEEIRLATIERDTRAQAQKEAAAALESAKAELALRVAAANTLLGQPEAIDKELERCEASAKALDVSDPVAAWLTLLDTRRGLDDLKLGSEADKLRKEWEKDLKQRWGAVDEQQLAVYRAQDALDLATGEAKAAADDLAGLIAARKEKFEKALKE